MRAFRTVVDDNASVFCMEIPSVNLVSEITTDEFERDTNL
jgi:hypothetical protein